MHTITIRLKKNGKLNVNVHELETTSGSDVEWKIEVADSAPFTIVEWTVGFGESFPFPIEMFGSDPKPKRGTLHTNANQKRRENEYWIYVVYTGPAGKLPAFLDPKIVLTDVPVSRDNAFQLRTALQIENPGAPIAGSLLAKVNEYLLETGYNPDPGQTAG